MSARRHLGRLRHRPWPDELAGVDDARVTAPAVEPDLYIKVVRLSDVRATPAPRAEDLTRGADLLSSGPGGPENPLS